MVSFGEAGSVSTYIAQWSANNCTVSFYDSNCMTNEKTGNALHEVTAPYNSALGETNTPASPSAVGYKFIGWRNDAGIIYSETGIADFVVTDNTEFVAFYVAEGKATVVFDYKGGTDGASGYTIVSGDMSTAVTVPIGDTDFTRVGYTFAGWVDEDKKPIDLITLMFGIPGTVTYYYATWAPDTHTVNFYAGDHGTMTPSTYSEEVIDGGQVISVPAIKANNGCHF